MHQTKLTKKSQTTVPRDVRRRLGVGPGDSIEWYIVEGRVIVDSRKRVGNPADSLLSSEVELDADAVKLVRKARDGIS